MGSWDRFRLLHILHFVMMDFLFPFLKNSKSGVDDRGHRFGSGSPLTNYPHATATLANPWIGFMLNMFFPKVHFCPKQLPLLSKKWA